MSDNPIIRSPSECTDAEIEAFVNLASDGGEVRSADLERGARRAEFLLWIEGDCLPRAVAALKIPFDSYREGVFEKARSPLYSAGYPLEFGYAFTNPQHRRRGLGRALARASMKCAEGRGVYATVRSDNDAMRALLRELGFAPSGSDYPSVNRSVSLSLFVTLAAPAKRG
jgi:GNAT superfamily N-acetyltransferase